MWAATEGDRVANALLSACERDDAASFLAGPRPSSARRAIGGNILLAADRWIAGVDRAVIRVVATGQALRFEVQWRALVNGEVIASWLKRGERPGTVGELASLLDAR
jgi:hypothetical protein